MPATPGNLAIYAGLVRRMVADGTLLFRAELERCLRLTGFRVPVRCLPPRKAKVAEVLTVEHELLGEYTPDGFAAKAADQFDVALGLRQDDSAGHYTLAQLRARLGEPHPGQRRAGYEMA